MMLKMRSCEARGQEKMSKLRREREKGWGMMESARKLQSSLIFITLDTYTTGWTQ